MIKIFVYLNLNLYIYVQPCENPWKKHFRQRKSMCEGFVVRTSLVCSKKRKMVSVQ